MPFYSDAWLTVYGGDCREVLRTLPAESVHCVVTSPPYWGLRDYGQEGQLGLEQTPEEYVAAMVDVFREVRRVLRSDGTVWLNLGDSYAASSNTGGTASIQGSAKRIGAMTDKHHGIPAGLKHKDLVGIPWRVAFALQADGWYLRSDIIWSKPNPMPESVTDRPTKSHEYLFLLAKSARYYFDADAVREPHKWQDPDELAVNAQARQQARLVEREAWRTQDEWKAAQRGERGKGRNTSDHRSEQAYRMSTAGRNIRSVWTIATAPYPGAHFATFPPKLVEPCVKAGTSERGVCPDCGAPWTRRVEVRPLGERDDSTRSGDKAAARRGMAAVPEKGWQTEREHVGWDQGCKCPADPVPARVLDPFAGTGTVGMVAQSLSRRAVLVDLNPDYLRQCLERNRDMPLGLAVG